MRGAVCYNVAMKRMIFCLTGAAALMTACIRAEQPVLAPTAPATAAPVEQAITVEIAAEETAAATAIPVPTEAPTPEPTETPAPTDTPEPTEEPTPEPEAIAFTASLDFPLPDETTQIQKDRPFWIDGTVDTLSPLVRVGAVVTNEKGKTPIDVSVSFDPSENVTHYEFLDRTFSREITDLSEQIHFQSLGTGRYTLTLTALDAAGNQKTLAECAFRITSERWIQLQPNNLRGNYTTALAFFGSPERFLFRYQRQKDSTLITVDPEWRALYDGEAVCVKGKKWRCHVDAIPYFEAAGRYIDSTYIHIASQGPGRRFDTGAVWLADLVTHNGSIVRRFTNSNLFISHHSFGTAVDINAHFASHKDKLMNREKIYREVTENLTYNGFKEVDGHLCYDFTYTGNAAAGLCKVPEPLMNYLLYELGFYRAGFSWGVYYPHTSDAMHFTLSELSPSLFTDGEFAMRKVFAYIDDPAATPEPSAEPEA